MLLKDLIYYHRKQMAHLYDKPGRGSEFLTTFWLTKYLITLIFDEISFNLRRAVRNPDFLVIVILNLIFTWSKTRNKQTCSLLGKQVQTLKLAQRLRLPLSLVESIGSSTQGMFEEWTALTFSSRKKTIGLTF